MKLRAQKPSLETSTPAGDVFKYTFVTDENKITEEDMSTMSETWINIEEYIKITNEVVDAYLYAIDKQEEDDVFCINGERKEKNDLLIVPEEEKNYTKMEIMDSLDNIQSYLKK